jgi:hypothetical protein
MESQVGPPFDEDELNDPLTDEVERWAERERRRRQRWLQGPTVAERRAARGPGSGVDDMPTDEEIELEVERIRQRRQAWVNGPSAEEKKAWMRRQARSRPQSNDPYSGTSYSGAGYSGPDAQDAEDLARRLRRDVFRAYAGAVKTIVDGPFDVWARLVSAGRDVEAEVYRPRRQRRITTDD